MTAPSVLDIVTVRGGADGLTQEISAGGHRLTADEPVSAGGHDMGPGPYDLVLAGLGACTSMTLALYARRKAWPLTGVTVRLQHARIHAKDCAECDTKEGMLDRIDREITVDGELTEEQRAKLLEIANKCPVHRTLRSEIDIRTRLA
jgi:putative redox protein